MTKVAVATTSQIAADAANDVVMRGGNALIFVDPVADADPASAPGMPQGMPPMGQGSDLPVLFATSGKDLRQCRRHLSCRIRNVSEIELFGT